MTAGDLGATARYRTTGIGLAIIATLLVFKVATDLIPALVWGSLTYSSALGANFLAIVAALCGVGRIRRAGIGYAVCGWGYWIFASFETGLPARVPSLITTVGFEALMIEPKSFRVAVAPEGLMLWGAHSLATITAGLAGGWFAFRLPGRGDDPARPTLSTTGQP